MSRTGEQREQTRGKRLCLAGAFSLVIALALTASLDAAERTRPVRSSGWFPMPDPGTRILWIAAHPDDEVLIAPLLGEMCVDRGRWARSFSMC